MIVDNYKDIRRRMLGELKPQVAPAPKPECQYCRGAGWLNTPLVGFVTCIYCNNPKGLPCP